MTGAEEQVEQYLYQGESIREAFDVGPVRVVLTSHRVFAELPDDEGLQQAELPNVTGVARTTRGSLSGVVWGISLGLIGVAFLAVGIAVRASDQFTAPEFQEGAAADAGADSLTDLVEGVLWVVQNLDVLMIGGGVLFLVLAVLPVVHYWVRVRERTLAIQLAGEQPDIHLPLEYISVEDEFRLEKALVPEQVSDDLPLDDTSEAASEGDHPGETPGDDASEELPDDAGDTDGPTTADAAHAGEEAMENGPGEAGDSDDDGFEWIGSDESTGKRADGRATDGDG